MESGAFCHIMDHYSISICPCRELFSVAYYFNLKITSIANHFCKRIFSFMGVVSLKMFLEPLISCR